MKKTSLLFCLLLLLVPLAHSEDGDALNVTLLASVDEAGTDIVYYNNYVYMGGDVYDVSNPSSPTNLGDFDEYRAQGNSAIYGNYLYTESLEFYIYDISDPETPEFLSSFETRDNVYEVVVRGNYAYIADRTGFTILNVSDPQNISEECYIEVTGYNLYQVAVSGDYAYLLSYDDLYIYNISNPSSPSLAGSCEYAGSPEGIVVFGDYVFIGGDGNPAGLRIIDISDPSNPSEVGYCIADRSAYEIKIDGNFAYVASHFNGITVLNISDPLNPIVVGYYDTPGYMKFLDVHENIVYATGTDYFHILDCSAATDDSPPAAFNLLTPANNTTIADDEVELSWSESSDDVYKYVLYTATNSSFTQDVDSVDVDAEDTEYNFDDLENNTTYWWKVRAQNANSTGRWSSQTWSFTIQQSDVGEHDQLPDEYAVTALYPNPFNPTLTAVVSLPMAVPLKVSVYNMLGKEVGLIANGVYPAGFKRFEFNGSNLSSGVYFLKVVVPEKLNHTEKVVLMK